MEIKKHILYGQGVKQVECTKIKQGNWEPFKIILHTTYTTNLDSAIKHLTNPKINKSAHIVIDRDGAIIQLAPFYKNAQHSGNSICNSCSEENLTSIGITLVNTGQLKKINENYLAKDGTSIHPKIVMGDMRPTKDITYWQTFPHKQIKALAEVCLAIQQKYPKLYEITEYYDIYEKRLDPGPAFDWCKLQRLINEIYIDSCDLYNPTINN